MKTDGQDEYRLAVENALSSAFADVDNDFIGWSSLKNLMSTVFPDHAKLRWWFDIFRTFQGGNGGENSLPCHAPWFEKLRDELRIMMNHRVNMSDDLTRISAMNWKKRLWQQYGDFNPKVFMKPIWKHNGIMYHIWGVPGSGKTDFALLLVENALEMGFTVITNIYTLDATLIKFMKEVPKKRPKPNFYRATRMSDLLSILVKEAKLKHDIIIVWDEVSAWMHKQDSAFKENIDFSRLIRLIRKFNANIFFLEQIDEGLSNVANEMLAVKFHKESQKKVHYITRFEERNYNLYLESVPRTSLHFKTGDFAGFKSDVDFKDMFEMITIENQGNKLNEIQKYLEAEFGKSPTKKKSKKIRKRKQKP